MSASCRLMFSCVVLLLGACGPDQVDRFTAGSAPAATPSPAVRASQGQPTYNGGGPSGAPVSPSAQPDPCNEASCEPSLRPLDHRFVVDPIEQRALQEKHNL